MWKIAISARASKTEDDRRQRFFEPSAMLASSS